MASRLGLAFLVSQAGVHVYAAPVHTVASVFWDDASQSFTLKQGVLDPLASLAHGYYDDSVHENGWGRLTLRGAENLANTLEGHGRVYYALGLLEGYLTCNEIATFYSNYYPNTFPTPPSEKLKNFIVKSNQWAREQAETRAVNDTYWRHMRGTQKQLDGLVDGYNMRCGEKEGNLTDFAFLVLNMNGDLFDLTTAFEGANSFWPGATPKKPGRQGPIFDDDEDEFIPTHCSALIKVTEGYDEVFMGHATWDTYSNAFPRIYKHVVQPVAGVEEGELPPYQVTVQRVSYSSMPGYLSSVDDFYIVRGRSNLTVTETSLSVNNPDLYQRLTPESIPSWARVLTANALASSGAHWTSLFARYNSGTYNNQWMVLDYNMWIKGQKPKPGFFHVLEQMPGEIIADDLTDYITKTGYFASYNIPFFERTTVVSGQDSRLNTTRHPELYSYDTCPRAYLFKTLQGEIKHLVDMQWVMGWNDWKFISNERPDDMGPRDELRSPRHAISSRYDIFDDEGANANKKPMAFGAIDAKIVSYSSAMQPLPQAWARAGPTYDEQPIFCWEGSKANDTAHNGHPPCFNFKWQVMQPNPDLFN
eukprot:comp23610_c0_seq1/m.40158 comp23610_c0_seq1/g.40158  ORF comp23610_c0_seq1/g.40158 comp23610_c0_seq1/m.40158 type:complete len:589 (-) comp23610_c0_seq1:788-2554(-)